MPVAWAGPPKVRPVWVGVLTRVGPGLWPVWDRVSGPGGTGSRTRWERGAGPVGPGLWPVWDRVSGPCGTGSLARSGSLWEPVLDPVNQDRSRIIGGAPQTSALSRHSRCLNEAGAILRDDPILLCANHQNADCGIDGGDVLVRLRLRVLLLIQFDAKESELTAGFGPDLRRVFSDSGGEYQHIEATQSRGHGSNSLSQTMHEHIEGESGSLVAALRSGF